MLALSMFEHAVLRRFLIALGMLMAAWSFVSPGLGQTGDPIESGLADQPEKSAVEPASQPDPAASPNSPAEKMNLLELWFKGGVIMIPISLMAVVVVMQSIERLLGLRREKVMPSGLISGLSELAAVPGVMDPREAFRLCQRFKSATATVIQAMLLKIGRPQSEVQHAVAEASQREAARMYANVRWLNLATAVTPLLGLLGTVWGMIQSFFLTTQLQAGQNKADFLAEGIYIALVTTLGGLSVAIPSSVLAHYFEARIQRIFHQIDELVFNLMPQIERFEGRMRVSPQTLSGIDDGDGQPAATERVRKQENIRM
jgi:biopolymer transport protein ExbB